MLRRLLNRLLGRRPGLPAATVPVAELAKRLDDRLAKRRAARAVHHDRACRAALTRHRDRLARDPLFNRGRSA